MLHLLLSGPAWSAPWPAGGDDSAPWTTDPLGIEIQDKVVGDGAALAPGAEATVNYTGLLSDGTVFDTTDDRGTPFTFRIGQHAVIAGWEDGVVGMRVGGVRRIVIPPELGYGSRSTGPIPPNSVLYFEIELVSMTAPRAVPVAPDPVAEDAWTVLSDGVRRADLAAGTGQRVRRKNRVCVDYAVWKGGQLVESTWTRSRCTWVRLGTDDLPAPVQESLVGMKAEGSCQVATPDGLVVYQVTVGATGK